MNSNEQDDELRARFEAEWPQPSIEHLLQHGLHAYDAHHERVPSADRGRNAVAMIAAASAFFAAPNLFRTLDLHSMLRALLSLEASIAKPFRRILLHHFVRVVPEYIMLFPFSILLVVLCLGLTRALFFSPAEAGPRKSALTSATLTLLLLAMWPTSFAAALTIEGDLPQARAVTASAESEPIAQALARIGAAARVSVVLRGDSEAMVSYHFERADFRDVLTTLLPEEAEVRVVGQVVSVTLPSLPVALPEAAASAPAMVQPAPVAPPTPARPNSTNNDSRHDVLLFGSDFTLEATESADSVAVVGGDVQIDGHVTHDVIVTGGKLTIRGRVDGDAVVIGGELILEDSAIVDGMTNVTGGHVRGQAHQSNGAPSRTQVQGVHGDSNHSRSSHASRKSSSWFGALLNLGLVLAVGLLLQSTHRVRWAIVRERLVQHPWQSLGFGFAAFVLTFVLMLGLVVSCIGIPVAAALFLAFAFALFASVAVSAEAIANRVGARISWPVFRDNASVQLLFGLSLLALAFAIPVLGALLLSCAIFAGLGAIASTRFGKNVQSDIAIAEPTAIVPSDEQF